MPDRETPMLDLLPDLETLYGELPWDAATSGPPRETALRVGALWHGRDYLLLRCGDRAPSHTASDGAIAALTVVNAALVEAVLFGFFTHGLGVPNVGDSLRNLATEASQLQALEQTTLRSIDRLRKRRNAIVHPTQERRPRIRAERSDLGTIRRLSFHRLPELTANELRRFLP